MDISLAQGSQISPGNRVEHLCIQTNVLLDNHLGVALEDFKQDDHVGLANVRRFLVHHELLVPLARILALNTHVEKACTHRHQKVDFLVRNFGIGVIQAHGLFIGDTRLERITFG